MQVPMVQHEHQYDAKALLDSQAVVVSVIDPVTHRVQFQNEAGLKMFGDISEQTCHEKIAGCSAPCSFCKMPEAVDTGTISWSEVQTPGNRWLLVQWSKVDTSEGVPHVIESITDITDRKRAEEDVRQVHKMEAIGRLAGGIAHDFNNLLTIVRGHCEELLTKLPVGGPERQHVEEVRHAEERAAMLTRKLLTFSRRQELHPEVIQLNTVLTEVESLLTRLIGEHIQIVMHLDPALEHILVDPVQVEQIIMNLIINARDAMSRGGTITVETKNVDLDEEFARQHRGLTPGEYVQLRVQDTGCGMDSETLAHVFEPFFTTKERGKGTGLGLATVYGFLKQSGGYIEVTSQPGRGSTFTVYLPRLKRQVEKAVGTTAKSQPQSDKGHETVLLVEDDTHLRMLLASVLRGRGYTVLLAADGIDALSLCTEGGAGVSLVITDVIMPRLTGPQLIRKLKALIPTVKVLYMSGYTGETMPADLAETEASYLQKPFGPHELARKVRSIMDA